MLEKVKLLLGITDNSKDGIISGILTLLPEIIECGIQLFIALIENIGEIISGIAKALPDLINGIVQAILEHLPEIIECGVKLFVALVENLPQILIEIRQLIVRLQHQGTNNLKCAICVYIL